jgi:AGCS family alanine or glycine:cation symporter
VAVILTYALGYNALASYNLQSTFAGFSFYNAATTPMIFGVVLAILFAICVMGGGKRLSSVTGLLVPVMGVAYILMALVIVFINITTLPSVLGRIFTEAFDLRAIFGGFGGSCVMYGIKRGLFSNEAGVGSAPNASASADVTHPAKQGLVQVLSVFIDTILVCSATAFMCMCSGVEPTEALSGAPFVQAALSATLGGFGPVFITVAMVLFAFTTLLGNLFYVNQAWGHVLGHAPSKRFHYGYYVIASALIFLGAGLSAGLLWDVADLMMGLMTVINLPVIAYLGRIAFRTLADYKRQRKAGVEPTFHAKDVGITDELDYWQ